MDELHRAAESFALGELCPEDLPMLAAEALARGLDTPALLDLACRLDELLYRLAYLDEGLRPELAGLAGDLSLVLADLDGRYSDPAAVPDLLRRSCRNFLAGPPYARLFQPIVIETRSDQSI
ncbi:hypothetical protein ACFXK0_22125 [Nocardia sp. NPDC059177]|uniref:hypothetical protein n=1 Tax=Nocardia sp. NPDC059177 TaxID=3346759 RepID=UPI0036B4A0AB